MVSTAISFRKQADQPATRKSANKMLIQQSGKETSHTPEQTSTVPLATPGVECNMIQNQAIALLPAKEDTSTESLIMQNHVNETSHTPAQSTSKSASLMSTPVQHIAEADDQRSIITTSDGKETPHTPEQPSTVPPAKPDGECSKIQDNRHEIGINQNGKSKKVTDDKNRGVCFGEDVSNHMYTLNSSYALYPLFGKPFLH